MNKILRPTTSRLRYNRNQKANARHPREKSYLAASHAPRSSNVKELSPHLRFFLILALMFLIGFIAHEHAMSGELLNLITQIIQMFK